MEQSAGFGTNISSCFGTPILCIWTACHTPRGTALFQRKLRFYRGSIGFERNLALIIYTLSKTNIDPDNGPLKECFPSRDRLPGCNTRFYLGDRSPALFTTGGRAHSASSPAASGAMDVALRSVESIAFALHSGSGLGEANPEVRPGSTPVLAKTICYFLAPLKELYFSRIIS